MDSSPSIRMVIDKTVEDYYRRGPRHEDALAVNIIAALGRSGFWISEDVTPWSNQAVAMTKILSDEIDKIGLREWAGSNLMRQRQVDEIRRLQKRAGKIAMRLSNGERT